mmetsp:Transcript_38718/g.97317  ORF Transcript_38718/g.97317 Transcript_38718/m.97317 type:complete len:280 (-) Transcript_38718:224-1063(-)
MLCRSLAALLVIPLTAMPMFVAARLGDSSTSAATPVATSLPGTGTAFADGSQHRLEDSWLPAAPAHSHGYEHTASSTQYGHTPATACGGVDTSKLVEGTDYFAVASAQAMQPVYTSYGGCGWECHDESGNEVEFCEYSQCASNNAARGCRCKQVGACWCGQASPANNTSTGTASMGCFSCARARFLRTRPYLGGSNTSDAEFVGEEIKVVVADACPHAPNSQWCPARPGDVNSCGLKNHLDFTAYPAGLGIDNNFVVFTPEPCSDELQQRISATSKCTR